MLHRCGHLFHRWVCTGLGYPEKAMDQNRNGQRHFVAPCQPNVARSYWLLGVSNMWTSPAWPSRWCSSLDASLRPIDETGRTDVERHCRAFYNDTPQHSMPCWARFFTTQFEHDITWPEFTMDSKLKQEHRRTKFERQHNMNASPLTSDWKPQ